MPRRQFQNFHQWPNATLIRRDHPITRGLYWCYFPVFNPSDPLTGYSSANQSPLAASQLSMGASTQQYPERQPFSRFYINTALGGRIVTMTDPQLPVGTDRSFTLLWYSKGEGAAYNSFHRNWGYDAGVPAFLTTVSNAAGATYRLGPTTAALHVQATTLTGTPENSAAYLGCSYDSATRRFRAYGNFGFTEGTYAQADFTSTQWTRPWRNEATSVLYWVMGWTRQLEPYEVFQIFRNPTIVLKQTSFLVFPEIPAIADTVDPASISETVTLGSPALDIGIEIEPSSISELVTLGAPIVQMADLTLAPSSISETASIPNPALNIGAARGLRITISDRLAEG